jgi:hypothetical protein
MKRSLEMFISFHRSLTPPGPSTILSTNCFGVTPASLALVLDLLAVLVGSGEKHHVVAAHSLVPRYRIGGHGAVGVADVQLVGRVIDGRCDVELKKIIAHCRERGLTLAFQSLTEEKKDELERLYPGQFRFSPQQATFDYIYSVEALTELRGKKLQAKRNHINRFSAEYPDWYTVPVTPDNIALCRELDRQWKSCRDEVQAVESEDVALERAFAHFGELEMDGLLLSDGSRMVAFSIGTRMNDEYYDVHFEKALPDVDGAYAVINREFSRMVAEKYPSLRFLNREDDMGLEGLRRAKESYQPALVLTKYVADYVGEL